MATTVPTGVCRNPSVNVSRKGTAVASQATGDRQSGSADWHSAPPVRWADLAVEADTVPRLGSIHRLAKGNPAERKTREPIDPPVSADTKICIYTCMMVPSVPLHRRSSGLRMVYGVLMGVDLVCRSPSEAHPCAVSMKNP